MKSLQEQYNKIKKGKGNKEIFLREAKEQFPNVIRRGATFKEAVKSLNSRRIISENHISYPDVIGGMGVIGKEAPAWETKYNQFLKEEAEVKAESKKTSKEVEDSEENVFDNEDEKNPMNHNAQQIINGMMFESSLEPDLNVRELREKVMKKLAKDPHYYLKNAMFGIEGIGWEQQVQQEATGKGSENGSGYGTKLKDLVQDVLKEGIKPKLNEGTNGGEVNKRRAKSEFNKIVNKTSDGSIKGINVKDKEGKITKIKNIKHFDQFGPGCKYYFIVSNNKDTKDLKENLQFMGEYSIVGDVTNEGDPDPRYQAHDMEGGEAGPFDFVDEQGNLKSRMLKKVLFDNTDAMVEIIDSYISDTESYLEPESYTGISLEDLLADFNSYVESSSMDEGSIENDIITEEEEEDKDVENVEGEEAEEEINIKADLGDDKGEELPDELAKETDKPKKPMKVKKETLDTRLEAIDRAGAATTLEAKIQTVDEEIASRTERMNMIGENQDLADLIDGKKLKTMHRDIKELERRSIKLKKVYEKMTKRPYEAQETVVGEGGEESTKPEQPKQQPSQNQQ